MLLDQTKRPEFGAAAQLFEGDARSHIHGAGVQRVVAACGYRGFQQTYRTCTPAADLVIRRYLEEGSKIAREMTARYAN